MAQKRKPTLIEEVPLSNNVNFSLTPLQKPIVDKLIKSEISILTGDPGTGKTTLALHFAVKQLLNKNVEKIYISKNPVESGASIGFLPGELADKLAPYKDSYFAVLEKLVSKTQLNNWISKGKIEFVPLGFIRGKTFENAVIILDEAQNLELHDLISFVTRIHHTSQMVVMGDALQSDIKKTGLPAFLSIVKDIKGIAHIELGDEHQMRSKIIVNIYNNYKNYLKHK